MVSTVSDGPIEERGKQELPQQFKSTEARPRTSPGLGLLLLKRKVLGLFIKGESVSLLDPTLKMIQRKGACNKAPPPIL